MSVTKLKTIGSWYAAYGQDAAASEHTMRGRVITGMLTGDRARPADAGPASAGEDPRGADR